MKKLLSICFVCLLCSCNYGNRSNDTKNSESIENYKNNDSDFSKTKFSNRAEELIYIREYLEYKLPIILVKKFPEEMKKAQYELISMGENPSLEEAAKKSLHFHNLYDPYMSIIISEKLNFADIKKQLNSNGKLSLKISESPIEVNEIPNKENNIPNDYLPELNQYSPKVSFVCQDQGYSDCIRDVMLFVKELSSIRKKHTENRNNEDYLSFYKTEQALQEKRSWKKDALDIDNYIIENINIYNNTLKECNYDWAKELPKDLYKYYNLDKAIISTRNYN